MRKKIVGKLAFECDRDFYVLPLFGEEHFKITFSEPLKQGSKNVFLSITHVPSGRCDVCIELVNQASVTQYDNNYRVYYTHVLDIKTWKTVYLQLENTNMDKTTCDTVPFLRPVFNFYYNTTNFRRLKFIPPDDIKGVNASIIPQSIPLWSKKRGQITSSGVPRFLGYFIPDPESKWPSDREKAKTWTLATKEDFTGGKSVNIRFGAQKEWEVIAIYLHNFPGRIVKETGYTVHPTHPKEWGASPDALVQVDDDDDIRTMEIKSSMWNDRFEGYHLAQVYWEMMCLEAKCGELIKYSEEATNDNTGVEKKCKLAVVERDAEMEEQIAKMAAATKNADKNTELFKSLVFSPEYRALRDKLDDRASNLPFDELEIPEEKIAKMEQERARLCKQEIVKDDDCVVVVEIKDGHKRLIEAVERKEKLKVIRLATEQIRHHTDLIKEYS